MNLKEAAEILEKHNKWRRDNNVPSKYEMADPEKLGVAIDTVVKFVKEELKNNNNVVAG